MKKSVFGLLFVFVLISSIIPSVFADSYVTITQTSSQTTNPVAIQNTAGTNLFIIDTSGNENYLSTNVAKFSNCGIVLRNTASTFATTICGGAVTANRTLNIPVITGTDTVATLGLGNIFTGQNDFTAATQKFGTSILGNGKYMVFPSNSVTLVGDNNTQTISGAKTFTIDTIFQASDALPLSVYRTDNVIGSAYPLAIQLFKQNSNNAKTVMGELEYYWAGNVAGSENANFGITMTKSGSNIPALVGTTTLIGLQAGWDFSVTGGNKIFVDGGGNNYIYQSSANTIDVYNGGTNNLRLDSNNNIILGQQANLTTSATNGFEYLGQTAGTPTGVPTSVTGHSGIVFDGTHNKFCIYNSGWKCTQLS